MTNTEITETIEKEFGWLSPDEKQKLNVMIDKLCKEAVASAFLPTIPLVTMTCSHHFIPSCSTWKKCRDCGKIEPIFNY